MNLSIFRIARPLLPFFAIFLYACDSSSKKTEQCIQRGRDGALWCTSDGQVTPLGDVQNKVSVFQSQCKEKNLPPLALTSSEKAVAVEVDFVWGLAEWAAIYNGTCYAKDPSQVDIGTLKTEIPKIWDARWKTDPVGFAKYYPNCAATIRLGKTEDNVTYTVAGCKTNNVTDPSNPNGEVPGKPTTAQLDVSAKIHFLGYYDLNLYNNGAALNNPKGFEAKTATEFISQILKGNIIDQTLPNPSGVKQLITVKDVIATDWERQQYPTSNHWGGSADKKPVTTPYVITVITELYNGNPRKSFTRFHTAATTDTKKFFGGAGFHDFSLPQDEFIQYQKGLPGENWTLPSLYSTEMHFNIQFVDRLVSFVHLFVQMDINGANPHEVFCSCSDLICVSDPTPCKDSGTRKFVQDNEYDAYVGLVNKDEYDGVDQANTGNKQIADMIKSLKPVLGFAIPDKGIANNSFYIFMNTDLYRNTIGAGGTTKPEEALLLLRKAVAHEVGHFVFGATHAKDPKHIMYSILTNFDQPILSDKFIDEKNVDHSGFHLFPGIWNQPK
jgi:hypothetical protein